MELLYSIVRCWLHGFGTKTGAEEWYRRHCIRENLTYYLGSQRRPRGDL